MGYWHQRQRRPCRDPSQNSAECAVLVCRAVARPAHVCAWMWQQWQQPRGRRRRQRQRRRRRRRGNRQRGQQRGWRPGQQHHASAGSCGYFSRCCAAAWQRRCRRRGDARAQRTSAEGRASRKRAVCASGREGAVGVARPRNSWFFQCRHLIDMSSPWTGFLSPFWGLQ